MPGQNAESIPRQAEADWLEAASMTTVMRGLKNSHMLAVGVWVVLALLTVGYAPLPVWAAVVVLTGVALVLRTRLLRGWRGLAGTGRVDAQLEFQRRYRWFWGGMRRRWVCGRWSFRAICRRGPGRRPGCCCWAGG